MARIVWPGAMTCPCESPLGTKPLSGNPLERQLMKEHKTSKVLRSKCWVQSETRSRRYDHPDPDPQKSGLSACGTSVSLPS